MIKVLIITYYWPPAGGPGVQRWLKFVKYLRNFEIEPVVYVPENPSYPMLDESLASDIPDGIRIIKKRIFEPYSLAGIFSKKNAETISSGIIAGEEKQSIFQKVMLYVRGNFFIPDARKFWIKPSTSYLKQEIENENYKAIITTGPPHSVHLIGLNLKESTHVKWIADFRDPWTQIGYHRKLKLTENSKRKHGELERKVLNTADHIITTSFTTRKEFISKTSRPVSVITNGFDVEINKDDPLNTKFEIAHIGSLLSERNPQNLWKVLGELVQENLDFRENFCLRLAGKVSKDIEESIREYGLQQFLKFEGYVKHSEAIGIQRNTALLLLIEIDSEETRGIIPGKLFEYLAAKRPLLAIGPLNWDAEKIISETSAGKVFQYHEADEIKSYILEEFRKYRKNKPVINSEGIMKYHRKSLTEKLANLIKQV